MKRIQIKLKKVTEVHKDTLETDTEFMVNLESASEDILDSILKFKEVVDKKEKRLVVCVRYPHNKISKKEGSEYKMSFHKWCEEHDITCSTSEKFYYVSSGFSDHS